MTNYFNSRFREGSDEGFSPLFFLLFYFNSRFREGSDARWNRFKSVGPISIHASAKEATEIYNYILRPDRFQFTLPRRKRPFLNVILYSVPNFNSRFREGSDGQCIGAVTDTILFQFTLPRRKRLAPSKQRINGNIFQFTLPRRKRPVAGLPEVPTKYFNSRFREGSDDCYLNICLVDDYFNSRFREGSDELGI